MIGETGPIVPLQFRRHPPSEEFGQHRDIALAGAQGRQGDDLETQPIEQVRAKLAPLGHFREIFVGRGDDADVDPDRARRSDPRDLAIFDCAQQAFLRPDRQRAELVEKQRTPVGFLEPPFARARRAGESAGLVAEQLGLDQRFGERGAVHDDQRLFPAIRQAVEPFGDQFLAGPPLAHDEHRTPHRGRPTGPLDGVEKSPRLTDELCFPFHSGIYSEKPQHLAICPNAIFDERLSNHGIPPFIGLWHAPCY